MSDRDSDEDRPGPYLRELGRTITAERERQGMTQENLAEACGAHLNTVSLIERGNNTTIGMLWWISRALDIDPSDLLDLAERGPDDDTE